MAKNQVLVAIFVVSVAAVASLIVQRDPFVRLIPADVLRGKNGYLFNNKLHVRYTVLVILDSHFL